MTLNKAESTEFCPTAEPATVVEHPRFLNNNSLTSHGRNR